MIETLLIFIAIMLTMAAGFIGFVRHRRKRELIRLRDAVRTRGALSHEAAISIFDVFWDLGASDFALEVMGSQGLLPRDLQEVPVVADALADRIAEEGGYSAFVRVSLETIQEFFAEHRQVGERRALPLMKSRGRKTLALPAVGAGAPARPVAIPRDRPMRDLGRSTGLLESDIAPFEIDLDEIVRVNPMSILKGVFFGRAEELERWWQMRSLRSLRDELNGYLRRLYDAYAFEANHDPDYYRHLYDLSRRWQVETNRLEQLSERKPWKSQPWSLAAEALVGEATATARQLSFRARANVDQTIELIHSHARRGDYAMAGYLVYLNHHALFVGRASNYMDIIQSIETVTYKLQAEVRELTKKQVI